MGSTDTPESLKGRVNDAFRWRLPNIDRRTDPRGNSYYWMCFHEDLPCSEQGTDIAALQERYISVTPLLTDLTDHGTAATMRSITLCTVEPREMEV